ncbi:phospholipid carrier-dependent glycosyltransferase, partial [filamentous cyanobacterium LEGE 11480]
PPALAVRIKPVIPYLGAAIAALNLQMFFFGRLGYSDMLLNLCISGGLLSFFRGYSQPHNLHQQRFWYWLLFVAMGFGSLTKGPVAVVLPGLIIGLFLLLVRQWKTVLFREIPWGIGLLIMLMIALPWYGRMVQIHGSSFITAFFGFHNVQRFTRVVNQHSGPWYYHFLILIPGMLPWSMALPAAIIQACRRPRTLTQPSQRSTQLGYFALIWFTVVMGFFTIASTKYLTYSLPALPAAAILIALWWNDAIHQQAWGFKLTNYCTLGLFTVMGMACFYCPNWLNDDPSMPNLGAAVTHSGLPWVGAGLWGVGLVLGCLYLRSPAFWRVKVITAAAFVLLFITPAFGVVDQVRQLPLRQVAEVVRQQQQPQEVVAMGTRSFGKPSLLFYSQRNIALMRRSREILPYIKSLRQTSPPPASLLLITTPKALQEAKISSAQYQSIAQVGIYQLVRIPIAPTAMTQ